MSIAPILLIIVICFAPVAAILWNKSRTKGRVFCPILRGDAWVEMVLCEVIGSYIHFNGKGYECHPQLVRICAYPSGWPKFLQENIPSFLLNETDGIPLDWRNPRSPVDSSIEIGTNLEPNIYSLVVREAAKLPGAPGQGFNIKKALPIILVMVGVLGLLAVFYFKNKGA